MLQGCPLCGHLYLPVVGEPQLAHHWVGLSLRMTGCEGCCVGAHPTEWESFWQGSGANWVDLLDTSFVELVGWCPGMLWSWPLGVLVLEPLVMDSGAGQDQLLIVLGLGPPCRIQKVIFVWLLLVIGLELLVRGYAVNQDWPSLVSGYGPFDGYCNASWGQPPLVLGL